MNRETKPSAWAEHNVEAPMVSQCCWLPLAGMAAFAVGVAIYVAARGAVGSPLAALAACGAAGLLLVALHGGDLGWWWLLDAAMAAAMATAAFRSGGFGHTRLWWRQHGQRWVMSWMTATGIWFLVFVAAGAVIYGSVRVAKRPVRRSEEGAVAVVEFVLLVPVLLGVVALAVVAGRITTADGQVQGAVRAAARAASIQRSPAAAQAAADDAARAQLQAAGVSCGSYTLQLAAGGPGGVDRVTLSCVVPLVAVDWVDAAPSKTIVASFSSPVDPYRGSQ